VRVIPPQLLGSLVGGFIVLTNSRTILNSFDVTGAPAAATYVSILVGWAAAVAWSTKRYRSTQTGGVAPEADGSLPLVAPAR